MIVVILMVARLNRCGGPLPADAVASPTMMDRF